MWTSERKGELVISGIMFCIGLFFILLSREMPHGNLNVPGPGFFPTLLGVLLCGSSFAICIRSFLYKTTNRIKIGHPCIWSTLMAIIVLAFFFERLGFILAITLFVAFLLKSIAHFRWIPCILWAVAAAISAYLLFDVVLGIELPRTPWF